MKFQPNCTLHFDATGPTGLYAVRVIIEDLDDNEEPLSKISLSFLLEVSADYKTCDAPRITAVGKSCTNILVDEAYQVNVVAETTPESPP